MKHRFFWLAVVMGMWLTVVFLAARQATALYSLEVTVKNNLIRTGSLAITVTPVERVLTADRLLPGESVSGELTVTNTGTAAARVTLSGKKAAGYKALYEVLQLEIREGEAVRYRGWLKYATEVGLAESLPAGESRLFSLRLTMPVEAGNDTADLYTNISLIIRAYQT